jgi:hypothetical protein
MALGNSSHCELLQPAHEYLRNGTAIRWEADAIVNSLLGKIMFVIPAGADTLRVALRCLCEFLEVLMRDGRGRGEIVMVRWWARTSRFLSGMGVGRFSAEKITEEFENRTGKFLKV